MKFFCLLMWLAEASLLGKIKHVVILMEENRSFDHMFGFRKGVNGLTGEETNPYNTSEPNGKACKVNNTSPYIGPFDPSHSVPATTSKIFGQAGLSTLLPTMDGFVEWEARSNADPSSVMNMFSPDRLPVMNALADNFVLMDRWFCSVPGPTFPNRLFQLLATSEGDTATGVWEPRTIVYTSKSIFNQFEEVGLDWKFYFADAPLEMALLSSVLVNPEHVHDWQRFKEDMRTGDLPTFSWVNPRWFVNATTGEGSNDMHPDHDVRLGEALIKEVYEDLRASPAWNETLFIVTFDEHGGFYDHVPPPMHVPAPDNSTAFPDPFDFTRLGVRVPVLMVSPWVAKGQVVGKPTGPEPDSEFDHTSIPATLRKLFGFKKPLTRREEWAGTFESILDQASPRTDCPLELPDAPKILGPLELAAEVYRPLNDLQRDIVKAFVAARGPDSALVAEHALPTLQGQGAAWMRQIVAELREGKHAYTHLD